MLSKKTKLRTIGILVASLSPLMITSMASGASSNNYGPFPVTVKGYDGSATNSVSYSGQIARHVLHDSLKKLASTGDGGSNAADVEAEMMAYFAGSDKNKTIVSPASKDDYQIKQTLMNSLSKGKKLSNKSYKGVINGWPGQMTGPEVLEFMIKKAAMSKGGFDPLTGYNYPQLISKFAMGAVFYNQAVDSYLDEKLAADNKPNGKPYKAGQHYTGKEHVWDEAYGYWGAAAHSLNLSAKQSYEVAKMKNFAISDANGDGVIDLKSEMTFAHAYYASSFDKGGKTNYLQTVSQAFLDGRKLITSANGENLTDAQRAKLVAYAGVIGENWERVIAESTFKYAGSVYKDISMMEKMLDSGEDVAEVFAKYCKHWGELKGFSMALQTGKGNLGETAVKLNRLISFGPVLLNASQVTGIDSSGEYMKDEALSFGEYKLHMLKVQKLMIDKFSVVARSNDQTANMEALAEKLGGSDSAEND